MRGRPELHTVLAALVVVLAACDVARPPVESSAAAAGGDGCNGCHGSADNAAPPASTTGLTATSERAVGAHQSHVRDGASRKAVACSECHLVPDGVVAPGHLNGQVEVFPAGAGQLARAGGATPTWNPDATCSNVYCHGAMLPGGSNRQPLWTAVDGTQAACGACHGVPPPAPHPSASSCGSCHAGYTATSVNLELHIDGFVELSGVACTGCHGSAARSATAVNPQLAAAPPGDASGNQLTSAIGVGAHQAHLSDGVYRTALACTECHVVPSDLSHVRGAPAVMSWGALATAMGASASWDRTTTTCSNYCHGAVATGRPALGGRNVTPVWTLGPEQAACGTCHGLPPPVAQGHPAVASDVTVCAGCHPGTTRPDGSIDTAGGKHVNGVVDVQTVHPSGWSDPTAHGYAANAQGLAACQACHGADFGGGSAGASCNACHGGTAWQSTCTFCHGDPNRIATVQNPRLAAAPPLGTQGQQATTTRAVGAHQSHLSAGALAPAFACSECHAVAADLSHVVGGPAVMTWGALAGANAARPTWDGTSCNNYCHGATLPASGGTLTTPTWTTTDGSQARCGTCHATTTIATGHHQVHLSRGYDCAKCHSGYTATSANAALHVNGVRDVGGARTSITSYAAGSCTPTCHGTRSW